MFLDFKKTPNIKAALRAEVDPDEFTLKLTSEPFPVRSYKRIAVKVRSRADDKIENDMSLIPLTRASEIRRAKSTMLATVQRGCHTYHRSLGWQGGSGKYYLDWNAREGFWICSRGFPEFNRWVMLFGTDDPADRPMLNIICEVNPPKTGIDRRCAGMFAQDADGAIYLTHNGKIGGGRTGIGKSAFRRHYRGAWESVRWQDGKETEVVVIGRLDSNRLASQLAQFVREVRRLKEAAETGERISTPNEPGSPRFDIEFAGVRRRYRVRSEIEARCDHGLIVNALADTLRAAGLKVANDRNRDLFVLGRAGRMELLFEAKTELTTSSIYQGIGQLFFHSTTQKRPPKLILVLPARPDAMTRDVLDLLGIHTLVFRWKDNTPNFPDLAEFI